MPENVKPVDIRTVDSVKLLAAGVNTFWGLYLLGVHTEAAYGTASI